MQKDTLDPVRWSRRRRARLIRAGAVAALLVVAAGVLFSGAGPATATRCVATPARARSSPHPTIPPGKLGVPVRVAQPGLADLLHPGDHVTLTVATGTATRAGILVPDALVLRIPSGDSAVPATDSVVYLAMTTDEARRTAALTPDARIGVTVRPG